MYLLSEETPGTFTGQTIPVNIGQPWDVESIENMSPDGTKFVFDSDADYAYGWHRLYVQDIDTGEVWQVYDDYWYNYSSVWTPDSQYLWVYTDGCQNCPVQPPSGLYKFDYRTRQVVQSINLEALEAAYNLTFSVAA